MLGRILGLLGAIACAAVVPAPAGSQDAPRVQARISPSQLQEALLRLGFGTERHMGRTDNIPELIGKAEGLNYSILFYRCEADSDPPCGVYQYWAKFTGPKLTADKINAWNVREWTATAYLRTDGAAVITITQRVEGGTTEANIASVFKDWRTALQKFPQFIGFKQ